MNDRDAYNLRDFLANQVRGTGNVAFVCVASYTCVDGTVMAFTKPTHVLVATIREAEPHEYDALAVKSHARALREASKGRCSICGNLTAIGIWPYCCAHEEAFGDEWDRCYECDQPATAIPVNALSFCSDHGGKTYQPRTKEA